MNGAANRIKLTKIKLMIILKLSLVFLICFCSVGLYCLQYFHTQMN